MITAKQMQEKSLVARYKKYGGKKGFKDFMRLQGSKGGKATQKKNQANLTA